MITKLSEVLDSYSVTDKTHGTVKFGPKEVKAKVKDNTAYLYLPAAGTAMDDLDEPHITIWGANTSTESKITSVEFTWASTKHVYYDPKYKSFKVPHTHSGDTAAAAKLELLLKLFLNAATIATITITTSPSSTPPSSPTLSQGNSNNSVNPSSASYATDWPLDMGAPSKKKF